MALAISENKENLSLSWETFLLLNSVSDEGKTRQETLMLSFTYHFRSPTPSAVISTLQPAEYTVMISQRYWIALNAVYFSKTMHLL